MVKSDKMVSFGTGRFILKQKATVVWSKVFSTNLIMVWNNVLELKEIFKSEVSYSTGMDYSLTFGPIGGVVMRPWSRTSRIFILMLTSKRFKSMTISLPLGEDEERFWEGCMRRNLDCNEHGIRALSICGFKINRILFIGDGTLELGSWSNMCIC